MLVKCAHFYSKFIQVLEQKSFPRTKYVERLPTRCCKMGLWIAILSTTLRVHQSVFLKCCRISRKNSLVDSTSCIVEGLKEPPCWPSSCGDLKNY
jgi:hypothetical protein